MKLAATLPLFCYLLFFISLVFSKNNLFAQCTTDGPRNGASFSNDASIGAFAFSSPGNAASSDDSRAVASATVVLLTGNSNYLKATNFGFSIPVTASICGIQVDVEKSAANINALAWVSDNSVRLVKNNVITGNNNATATHWTTSDGYYSYGGNTDLWGTTWGAADINSANFGVVFSAIISGVSGLLPDARIDHMRMTVYYLDIPLALSLINFNVRALPDHTAKLEWTTTNNDDEVVFNIQRSNNETDWTTIQSLEGHIIAQNKNYQYTDAGCNDKSAYYRLQAKQNSGKIKYSEIQRITWQDDRSFSIYPNPAKDIIHIEQKEILRSVYCIDISGRYWPLNYTPSGGIYKIDISHLPAGSYVIQADENRKLFVKN